MIRSETFQWKIGGEAGQGIKVTGQMFAKMCARHGLNVVGYSEYPSLIRGGHNTYQVLASRKMIRAPRKPVDLLIALTPETIAGHFRELGRLSTVIYDAKQLPVPPRQKGVRWRAVPFEDLAVKAGGSKVMRNTVALGATFAMMGCDFGVLKDILEETFRSKGEVAKINVAAARLGFDYIHEHYGDAGVVCPISMKPRKDHMVLTGNDAIALGAIAGGLQAYFAYPMTPSTTILTALSAQQKDYNMVVRQCEDEISVINEAIGASFAGARTMIGTSGGGFSLMVEGLGLAAITETPLVIAECQRPGPATGLPTWTGQADLRFAIHSHQDEFPRVVLTPGDVEEAFFYTAHALNIADLYQVPVLILSDKYLSEGDWSQPMFDASAIEIHRGAMITTPAKATEKYARYLSTRTGVSPRSIPGVANRRFVANSDEHDVHGWSSETHTDRIEQMRKRFRKLPGLLRVTPNPKRFGGATADLTLIGWGSTKGAMLDAMEQLKQHGEKVNVIHVPCVWPFPTPWMQRLWDQTSKTLLVEGNYSGQFGSLIAEHLHRSPNAMFLKYDGRPIYPEEIVAKARELL